MPVCNKKFQIFIKFFFKIKNLKRGQYYSYDKSNLPSIENRRWLRWEFHYDVIINLFDFSYKVIIICLFNFDSINKECYFCIFNLVYNTNRRRMATVNIIYLFRFYSNKN